MALDILKKISKYTLFFTILSQYSIAQKSDESFNNDIFPDKRTEESFDYILGKNEGKYGHDTAAYNALIDIYREYGYSSTIEIKNRGIRKKVNGNTGWSNNVTIMTHQKDTAQKTYESHLNFLLSVQEGIQSYKKLQAVSDDINNRISKMDAEKMEPKDTSNIVEAFKDLRRIMKSQLIEDMRLMQDINFVAVYSKIVEIDLRTSVNHINNYDVSNQIAAALNKEEYSLPKHESDSLFRNRLDTINSSLSQIYQLELDDAVKFFNIISKYPLILVYLEELGHVIQIHRKEHRLTLCKVVFDSMNPKRYETPGTFEYEAHSILAPMLMKKFLENYDKYSVKE